RVPAVPRTTLVGFAGLAEPVTAGRARAVLGAVSGRLAGISLSVAAALGAVVQAARRTLVLVAGAIPAKTVRPAETSRRQVGATARTGQCASGQRGRQDQAPQTFEKLGHRF